eukprot:1145177-Pelagomonas_calceolata.AAC.1
MSSIYADDGDVVQPNLFAEEYFSQAVNLAGQHALPQPTRRSSRNRTLTERAAAALAERGQGASRTALRTQLSLATASAAATLPSPKSVENTQQPAKRVRTAEDLSSSTQEASSSSAQLERPGPLPGTTDTFDAEAIRQEMKGSDGSMLYYVKWQVCHEVIGICNSHIYLIRSVAKTIVEKGERGKPMTICNAGKLSLNDQQQTIHQSFLIHTLGQGVTSSSDRICNFRAFTLLFTQQLIHC